MNQSDVAENVKARLPVLVERLTFLEQEPNFVSHEVVARVNLLEHVLLRKPIKGNPITRLLLCLLNLEIDNLLVNFEAVGSLQ